jgi:hypothetical protein
MTPPAAIQASYADYRRIKGRKVLQLILEVPLEQAPQVHEAFGEPLPDGSTWVAVARIDPNAAPERKGGKLAQRAGILCNEGAFWQFLADGGDPPATNSEEAADAIREYCGVKSRAELDHNEEAARKFLDLEASYKAWLKVT